MKTVSKYEGLAVPGWALSYLVNGDDSGISEEDKQIVNEWYEQFAEEGGADPSNVIFSIESEEPWFTWNPEFGLACDCYDCTVLIVN